MSVKKREATDVIRATVPCTKQQIAIIDAAAEQVGTSRSTFMLAHALRVAGAANVSGIPIIIDGTITDRLRSFAEAQGISVDQLLDQMLTAWSEPASSGAT